MAKARPYSPRALQFRHRKMIGWSIALLAVWLLVSIGFAAAAGGSNPWWARLAASQILAGALFVVGVLLLIVGIRGEIKSHRFNRADWAIADGIGTALDGLWRTPADAAYEQRESLQLVPQARLVEIERHFDQQTQGAIVGSMSHKLSMFGAAFSQTYGRARHSLASNTSRLSSSTVTGFGGTIRGLSSVDLGISTTTRDNLMGDALFSVFEAVGPAGDRDTYRVISMSQPGVRSWINDLVEQTAQRFGGRLTHSGTTVLTWSGNLMAQFQPNDISYVTDRLKAISTRPYAQREPVDILGSPVGRNAMLATSVRIAGGEELRLMPSAFPTLFGTAIAEGVSAGEQTLEGSPRQAITS